MLRIRVLVLLCLLINSTVCIRIPLVLSRDRRFPTLSKVFIQFYEID